MTRAIYLVTAGEYSEYSVCAVFSTKEKAQAFIEVMDWGGCKPRIEDYHLDCMDERFREKLQFFKVWMDLEGNTQKIEQPKPDMESIDQKPWIWGEWERPYGSIVHECVGQRRTACSQGCKRSPSQMEIYAQRGCCK